MTKEERKLAEDLAEFLTVELHRHVSVNGKKYWKCKKDGRALRCITYSLCDVLDRRGLLQGNNSLKLLDVYALRANLFDWQTRKSKRENRKPRVKKDNDFDNVPENIF